MFIQTEQLNAMDAVHVSIALHHHCQCVISTDKHFRDLKAIQPSGLIYLLFRKTSLV